ncbi:hypothetical protein PHMEG_0001234 [Phytophthora megakarya]|uniref:Uncharacterized protein n=1 Tax=Phytophthora megakarya TaxID=4795 RepID=A0A225X127_9STRA|nr:hypothetical protein PHMEG_0001234 [Phytophthora megakarya]
MLKKNGVNISLCIDYKMVNSMATVMEYAIPLGSVLLMMQVDFLGQNDDFTDPQDIGICVSIRTLRMVANAVWPKQCADGIPVHD